MKKVRESVSMKDCWELSKLDSIGYMVFLALCIVMLVKLDIVGAIACLLGMNVCFNNCVSRYDDQEFAKLQDKIKELENK